jgi:hypothetical protein
MKKCNTCGKTKECKDFHLRRAAPDLMASKCKACQSLYDKSRSKNPERAAARYNYSKTAQGIESGNRAKKKWAANNKGKVYEITKSYREKNPTKYKAHGKISYAIKTGLLARMPCEVCSSTENIHAHHDDYSKPLNIRWLCAIHHNKWHKINGEGLNAH